MTALPSIQENQKTLMMRLATGPMVENAGGIVIGNHEVIQIRKKK